MMWYLYYFQKKRRGVSRRIRCTRSACAFSSSSLLAWACWTCSPPVEGTSPGTILWTRCWRKARWHGCRWCPRVRLWRSTSTPGLSFSGGLCVFPWMLNLDLKLDPHAKAILFHNTVLWHSPVSLSLVSVSCFPVVSWMINLPQYYNTVLWKSIFPFPI